MEQPPKGMPTEQLPLDLGDHEAQMASTTPETKEVSFETLETGELERLFEEKVGYDPRMRFLSQGETERRATLIEGILDPVKGKDAVGRWDADYDKIGDAWSGR